MRATAASARMAGAVLAVIPLGLIGAKARADDGVKSGVDEYRIIFERNMFDPNRRRFVPRAAPVGPPPMRPSEPPSEAITLTGVIVSLEQQIAFFRGSRREHSVAVARGEAIVGMEIAAMDSDGVVLNAGEKRVELLVGGSLVRRGDQDWAVSTEAPPAVSESSDSGAAPASEETTDDSDKATPAGASDLLKRMLERRQRELQK